MNILYVTPYLPVSGSHGCASKNWDDIETLSSNHRIHLVCFVAPEDKEKVRFLEAKNCEVYPFFVQSYQGLAARHQPIRDLVEKLLKSRAVDIIQCECSFMARHLPPFGKFPSLLVEHQVYWLHFWREFKVKKKPIALFRILKNIIAEKMGLSRFGKVVFFSQHDRRLFGFLVHDLRKTQVIPLGIDIEHYRPQEAGPEYDACFLGNFFSYPNEDAVMYFVLKILPLIEKTRPDFSLLVIGENSSRSLEKLVSLGCIETAGSVKDVRPYLAKARIFINPMRLGSGMRRKVLEAWAMGKPVVSTTIGCEGLDARDRENILIADTPEGFARAINTLLEDGALRLKVGQEARKTVEDRHDRRKIAASQEELYAQLTRR